MSKGIWRILAVVEALIALAVVLVAALKGGCTMQIETAAGGQVPMKCHWTFLAVELMAGVGIVSALLSAIASEMQARRFTAILSACLFVIVLLAVNVVMGICSGDMSACKSTALIVNILAAIGLLIGIVLAATVKDDSLPQARL